jgi:hypothetical protein
VPIFIEVRKQAKAKCPEAQEQQEKGLSSALFILSFFRLLS